MRRQYVELGQERWLWLQLAQLSVPHASADLAQLLVDLVSNGGLGHVHASSPEAGLITACAERQPAEVWSVIGRALEASSWQLQLAGRGWIAGIVPITIVKDWVGENLVRARLVAGVASVGETEPSDAARFLLSEFGEDDKTRSSLYSELVSGAWWGEESARTQGQIDSLTAWLDDEEPGIRNWAGEVVESLRKSREAALLREAEEGWKRHSEVGSRAVSGPPQLSAEPTDYVR